MITKAARLALGIFIVATLTVGCLGLPSAVSAQQAGQVMRVQGTGLIQRAGQQDYQPARRGDPVNVQDVLVTDPSDSKLWMRGIEKSEVSLGRSTAFTVMGLDAQGDAAAFSGQVPQGIVRFIKRLPHSSPPSSYTVFTPTAMTMVMPTSRAADFVVEAIDEHRSVVTCIWGEIRVDNIDPQFSADRLLRSCQTVVVEKDQPPSPVMWVTTDALRELIRRTTIPNTLPRDVPQCQKAPPLPESPLPYDYDTSWDSPTYIIPGGPGFIPLPPYYPPFIPTYPTVPTMPTMPTTPTTPTTPTMPTTPTTPTMPTTPTTATTPTMPTIRTFPTFVTLRTFPTLFTLRTFPTVSTLPTLRTFPTFFTFVPPRTVRTFPTLVTLRTFPTLRTFLTLPTVRTFPSVVTLRTFPTFITLRTFPTVATLRTFPTFATLRTFPTFATRLTLTPVTVPPRTTGRVIPTLVPTLPRTTIQTPSIVPRTFATKVVPTRIPTAVQRQLQERQFQQQDQGQKQIQKQLQEQPRMQKQQLQEQPRMQQRQLQEQPRLQKQLQEQPEGLQRLPR